MFSWLSLPTGLCSQSALLHQASSVMEQKGPSCSAQGAPAVRVQTTEASQSLFSRALPVCWSVTSKLWPPGVTTQRICKAGKGRRTSESLGNTSLRVLRSSSVGRSMSDNHIEQGVYNKSLKCFHSGLSLVCYLVSVGSTSQDEPLSANQSVNEPPGDSVQMQMVIQQGESGARRCCRARPAFRSEGLSHCFFTESSYACAPNFCSTELSTTQIRFCVFIFFW